MGRPKGSQYIDTMLRSSSQSTSSLSIRRESIQYIKSLETANHKLHLANDQLRQRVQELDKLNYLMVERELTMTELKKRIKKLEGELRQVQEDQQASTRQ
jgi:predicted  nucleic acid-binding Zn-ribbon protein